MASFPKRRETVRKRVWENRLRFCWNQPPLLWSYSLDSDLNKERGPQIPSKHQQHYWELKGRETKRRKTVTQNRWGSFIMRFIFIIKDSRQEIGCSSWELRKCVWKVLQKTNSEGFTLNPLGGRRRGLWKKIQYYILEWNWYTVVRHRMWRHPIMSIQNRK